MPRYSIVIELPAYFHRTFEVDARTLRDAELLAVNQVDGEEALTSDYWDITFGAPDVIDSEKVKEDPQ